MKTIYIHKPTGLFLLLVKVRISEVNTFVEVDHQANVITKKRDWSCRPEEQRRLVKGFDNLEVYKTLPAT